MSQEFPTASLDITADGGLEVVADVFDVHITS